MAKFKVGDRIICLPGFKAEDMPEEDLKNGGMGYKDGTIHIISELTAVGNGWFIIWPEDKSCKEGIGHGIYSYAVKKYLDSIEKIEEKIKKEIGL